MSLAAPLGNFLTTFDNAITTAQTTAVAGLATAMQAPLASMAVIYFAFMGWRVARGDLQLVHDFTVHMAKIGFIFYLATNLTAFNTWIVGLYEQGIPNALARAVTSSSSTVTSVSGVAQALDALWGQLWTMALAAWSQAGMFDVSSRLAAFLMIVFGGVALMLDAGVYLLSRFLFAVVIILGPVAIACAMFGATRPIFERWIGKGVAMIVLQVAAIITLQVVLTGSATFMATYTTPGATPDLPTQLQNMIAVVIWLGMGAFAIYSLPAVAYSIGTGVMVSAMPLLSSRGAAASAMPSLPSLPSVGGDAAPELNLSMARAELAGGGGSAALPPPAPPALPFAPPPLLLGYDGG